MTTMTGPHRLAADLRSGDSLPRRLRNAALLHLDGDLTGARRLYEQVLVDDPGNAVAISNLGLLLQQVGDVEAACELFDGLGDDVELSVGALTNSALALIGAGEIDRGTALLEQAVATAPDHGPWTSLAKVRLLASDADGAVSAARAAVQARPASTESWRVLGTCAGVAGDVDGAITAFGRLVELDRADAPGWRQLGAAMFARRDLGSAGAATARSIDLDQTCAASHHQMGMIALAAGNRVGACAAFDTALALAPSPTWAVDRAIVHLACGEPEEAVTVLEGVDVAARGQLYLGYAYLAVGRTDEAVAVLSAAAASSGAPEAERAREALAGFSTEGASDG